MTLKEAIKVQEEWLEEAKKRGDYETAAKILLIIERNKEKAGQL